MGNRLSFYFNLLKNINIDNFWLLCYNYASEGDFMRSLEELTTELEKVSAQIAYEEKQLKKAIKQHAKAVETYNAEQNLYNESGVIVARTDVTNCNARLFLLREKEKTLKKLIEIEQEKQSPQPGN